MSYDRGTVVIALMCEINMADFIVRDTGASNDRH